MTQIVINACHGGFALSEAAGKRYREITGFNPEYIWDFDRSDPYLVRVVKELGEAANGPYSHLKIVTIPDDVEWQIEEYDGREWVAEVHRTWE